MIDSKNTGFPIETNSHSKKTQRCIGISFCRQQKIHGLAVKIGAELDEVTTLDQTHALNKLHAQGRTASEEELACLSPYLTHNGISVSLAFFRESWPVLKLTA